MSGVMSARRIRLRANDGGASTMTKVVLADGTPAEQRAALVARAATPAVYQADVSLIYQDVCRKNNCSNTGPGSHTGRP